MKMEIGNNEIMICNVMYISAVLLSFTKRTYTDARLYLILYIT